MMCGALAWRQGSMDENGLQGLARFAYELGHLKQSARTGWWMVGVSHPESVAEHTLRTALLGFVLAEMEGADAARTAVLCLFHDVDRLECLVQAREYQVQGYEQITPWIESSRADLRSITAQRLAAACLEVSPGDWWR